MEPWGAMWGGEAPTLGGARKQLAGREARPEGCEASSHKTPKSNRQLGGGRELRYVVRGGELALFRRRLWGIFAILHVNPNGTKKQLAEKDTRDLHNTTCILYNNRYRHPC